MSQEDRYFQFPLCALRFGSTLSERFNGIIAYAYLEAGQSLWNKLPEEKQDEWIEYFEAERAKKADWLPGGVNFNKASHHAALYGMRTLNIRGGNLDSEEKAAQALRNHERACLSGGTKDAVVRIKTEFVWETRDEQRMTYPEFAVLCAIYSVVGSKQFSRITLETIEFRAHGYKSKDVFKRALEGSGVTTTGLGNLTAKRLRNIVAKLHQLKFFARVTYGQRQTYYSHRLDEDELRKKVFASKTFSSDFQTKKRLSDNDLTAAIRAQRARNDGKIKLGRLRVKHPGTIGATEGQL